MNESSITECDTHEWFRSITECDIMNDSLCHRWIIMNVTLCDRSESLIMWHLWWMIHDLSQSVMSDSDHHKCHHHDDLSQSVCDRSESWIIMSHSVIDLNHSWMSHSVIDQNQCDSWMMIYHRVWHYEWFWSQSVTWNHSYHTLWHQNHSDLSQMPSSFIMSITLW